MDYEDRISIQTPEGVDLELTLAGIGSRIASGLIDLAVQLILIGALTVLAFQLPDDPSGFVISIYVVATFLILFGYPIFWETLGSGRTPGKRLTGLRVVRSGGLSVGFLASAVRNLVRIVDFLPSFYVVATLFIFFSPRNQRLGDIAAGTLVVRERRGDRKAAPTAVSNQAAHSIAALDVSAISVEDLTTVRRFLDRRVGLTAEARATLARDLDQRLRPRVAGAPSNLAAEEFLQLLAAAKSART